MIRRLTRISPWQAGKIFATIYFLCGLVVAIPLAIFSLLEGPATAQSQFGLGFAIALPIVYALAGLIFVPFACWVYNTVAKFVGGLEFTVEDGVSR